MNAVAQAGPFAELSPPYSTIVADPPWPFRWSGGPGGKRRNASPPMYSLMTLEDIVALPVSDLAADDAHLYLWVTPEMNRKGNGVRAAEAWGFAVVDEIVWEKPNFGVGVFPRHCHEPLLVCRRGHLPYTATRDVRSVQRWRQPQMTNGGKTHSAKPDAALDLIESASPGPYVELFCRRPRLGWDSWGHGYEMPHPMGTGPVAETGVDTPRRPRPATPPAGAAPSTAVGERGNRLRAAVSTPVWAPGPARPPGPGASPSTTQNSRPIATRQRAGSPDTRSMPCPPTPRTSNAPRST